MRIRAVFVLVAAFVATSLLPASMSDARAAQPDAADPFTVSGPAALGHNAAAADRYIVVLRAGMDAAKTAERHERSDGLKADRVFSKALRGFSAKLDAKQRSALAADPSVAAIVPDEVIELAGQIVPTGVSRIGVRQSETADVDGSDQRVDADVAIVDTGIDPNHRDLNVVGGRNCTSSSTGAWGDVEGHGTHVAGTVGAIDNGTGVVGVAPGVRLWSVRILGSDGNGLLSWYVCGLDWIAAQRDPADPSRPLFEAVNMSVTKWGTDDHACGSTNNDVLHQAICRLVDSGVTVVAAAANDHGSAAKRVPASYDEVITVSALADTDGKPGSLGGHRCWSWGTYDVDDTFADFSNYGSDVDLIAPGKCIWSSLRGGGYGYSSGTSMAAPHVTGAVALYKATRPWATPREVREALVSLGTYGWRTGSDPDGSPDRLLAVDHIGPYGDFSVGFVDSGPIQMPVGGRAQALVRIERSASFVERVHLAAAASSDMALTFAPGSLLGLDATQSTLTIDLPDSVAAGTYTLTLTGTEHGRTRQATTTIEVSATPGRETSLTRLAGLDRFETAAAVSAATFAPGVDTVYVASAYRFPDALAGAAAAGTVKGPLLLVDSTGPLAPATITELVRLKPARIVVLGGTGVVSSGVASALDAYTTGPVTRLAGLDRFETAAAVSAATFAPGVDTVYVASAYRFPDALAGAAAAGTVKGPLLLVDSTGPLAPATITELVRLKPARIVVLGGTGVISSGVASALDAYTTGPVTRLAGLDRFETAAAVSAATFAPGVDTVYVASAYRFPDALAGAAAAGTVKGPLLLVDSTGPLAPATITELVRLKPARIVVLGGTGVVSSGVSDRLAGYLVN